MNIDQLYTVKDHEEGAEMQIKDKTGNLVDMYLTVVGLDSKVWRRFLSKSNRLALKGDDDVDVKLFTDSTLDWRGFEENGKPLNFSKEKVFQLYKNAPYIMNQVDAFIGNRKNFIKD